MKDAKGHGSDSRGSYQNVSTKPLVTNAARQHVESQSGMSYENWVKAGRPNLGSGEAKVQDIAGQHGVPTGQLTPGGRFGYNPHAVNQAIASSNRAGRRIGGREAKMIHALLKGRG